MTKILITCALPYANGPNHLGHMRSTYIPADTYARYNRMKGNEVLFTCATDEHGTPIAVKAEREGKTPLEIATRYHKMLKKDVEDCNISFDSFTRTTDKTHYDMSQKFFLHLYKKGYIYEKEIQQLYCENCKRFLPDRYVEGTCPVCGAEGARGDHCEVCGRHLEPTQLKEPRCLNCDSTPKIRNSKHYFFKLSEFEEQIKEWINNNDELDSNVRNYALNWLKDGLKDWILTRDMDWGIPVPLDGAEGKIIYVWGEAFIGYLSAAAQWSEKTNKPWIDYWNDKAVHFIGKDIIYHHSIFWPGLLMAHSCNLPTNVIAGEFLSLEGQKMSTSRNWVVWVQDFLKYYDSDLLRYYLTVNAPLNKDTDFSWDDFQRRINDELADVLGNFLHRTFTFTKRFYDSKIPEKFELNSEDKEFEELIKSAPEKVGSLIDEYKFREGLMEIIKLAKAGNKYFNDKEPWKTQKESSEDASNCLYLCNQLAKTLGVMMQVYLPVKAKKILKILNIADEESIKNWDVASEFLEVGHPINKPKPLFKKIEDKEIDKRKEELLKNSKIVKENEEKESMSNLISIDDFGKIDLRVGQVIEAESVPKSDKLLKLKVDIKEKTLQIVAGLAKSYTPEEILNQKVIVIVNLQPAKLFGIESQGMLLATDNSMGLLTPQKGEIGEKIR